MSRKRKIILEKAAPRRRSVPSVPRTEIKEEDVKFICGFIPDDLIDSMAKLADDYRGFMLNVDVTYRIINGEDKPYDGPVRSSNNMRGDEKFILQISVGDTGGDEKGHYKHVMTCANMISQDFSDIYGVLNYIHGYDSNHRCKDLKYEIAVKLHIPGRRMYKELAYNVANAVFIGDSKKWGFTKGKVYNIDEIKPAGFLRSEKYRIGNTWLASSNFDKIKYSRFTDDFLNSIDETNKSLARNLGRLGYKSEVKYDYKSELAILSRNTNDNYYDGQIMLQSSDMPYLIITKQFGGKQIRESYNMKHLKTFENFEEREEYVGLPSEQEEDLREIFYEFLAEKDFNYEKAMEYFIPGSETFTSFLKQLEDETEWFDYRQMDLVFQEISMYLAEFKEEEEEEASEDDYWDDTNFKD